MTVPVRGLCPICAHVRLIHSAKGSTFLRCQEANVDPRLPKYPPQPRLRCESYVPREEPSR